MSSTREKKREDLLFIGKPLPGHISVMDETVIQRALYILQIPNTYLSMCSSRVCRAPDQLWVSIVLWVSSHEYKIIFIPFVILESMNCGSQTTNATVIKVVIISTKLTNKCKVSMQLKPSKWPYKDEKRNLYSTK